MKSIKLSLASAADGDDEFVCKMITVPGLSDNTYKRGLLYSLGLSPSIVVVTPGETEGQLTATVDIPGFVFGKDIFFNSLTVQLGDDIEPIEAATPELYPLSSIDGIPCEKYINVNPFNFWFAISSGQDPSSGTSLLYSQGVNNINSRNYKVYEIPMPLDEFYGMLVGLPE